MGISKHWYTFIVFNNILKQFFILQQHFWGIKWIRFVFFSF